MAKDKLTDEVQAFIVQALACYDAPSVVAEAVKQEFGITISRQLAEAYDPNKRAAKNLAQKWKVLFEATRKAFLKDQSQIGIAQKSVRMRALHRMAERAEAQRNYKLAAELYEQAAKEEGGAYTNTRVLRGGLELTTPKTLSDFYAGSNT